MELPSQQTNCNVCKVPSQCSECTRRQGITKRQGQFRMETRCFSLPSDCNTHGITNSGSFCIQKTLLPTSSIYCIETRLEYYSNRCIPGDKREHGFTFPPFSLINRVLRKVLKEKIDHLITVKPTQQTQPWYAQLPKMSVQLTISSASDKKIVNKSTRQN